MPSDTDPKPPTAVSRRWVLRAAAALAAIPAWSSVWRGPRAHRAVAQQPQPPADGLPGPLRRIAFGSCAEQDKPQPIWNTVLARRPQLFIMAGDNIYGDTHDMAVMRAKYAQLAAQPGFAELRRTTPLMAIWDDHDYGQDDGGADYPMRAKSRTAFLDFFAVPAASPRRTQPGGIYTAEVFGQPGQRLQIILLDVRYERSPLTRAPIIPSLARRSINRGPYAPETSPDAQMIGEHQWSWLADQLALPADLRLIVSSTPVLSTHTGWETWANMPGQRDRLLQMIAASGRAVILSGDIHGAELSRDDGYPTPLWELTSSGLTKRWPFAGSNRNRIGRPWRRQNFGLVEIDWPRGRVDLQAISLAGDVVVSATLDLAELG